MTLLLIICHLFFTLRLRFVIRYTLRGIKYTFTPKSKGQGIGTYAAFASALGTTIGPGNITGVAVAVSSGGVGAVVWMWVCGVLAMSTKYAESYLSIRFADNGVGGTMVLLKRDGYNRLSLVWTLACAAGGLLMGASVPVNSLAAAVPMPRFITGILITLAVILTVSFGFSGISRVCSLIVPVMSGAFLLFCIYVIIDNALALPSALSTMLSQAFSLSAVAGGSLGAAVRHGMKRGLYSNESGLGSGGVLAAESGDTNHTLSALSAMTTVFWDTVVMCAVTGVMLAVTGGRCGMPPSDMLNTAFCGYPLGKILLPLSMWVFVFATVVGWYYIAKRVLDYSFSRTSIYDVLFIGFCFFGALLPEGSLWKTADAVNALMLVPSLFALFVNRDKISLYINDN